MEILKQKKIYRAQYELKLSKGKLFKATQELSSLKERFSGLGDSVSEDEDKIRELKQRFISRIKAKSNEISDLTQEVKDNEDKLANYNHGGYDDDINEEYEDKEGSKAERRLKRFEKNSGRSAVNKDKSQKFFTDSVQASRETRFKKRDISYGFRYFQSTSEKLPDYIYNELKTLPNNKGYIFKSITFYGLNNDYREDGTLTLYELRGNKKITRTRNKEGNWTTIENYRGNKGGNRGNKPQRKFKGFPNAAGFNKA